MTKTERKQEDAISSQKALTALLLAKLAMPLNNLVPGQERRISQRSEIVELNPL
jgi:hypothetical protein